MTVVLRRVSDYAKMTAPDYKRVVVVGIMHDVPMQREVHREVMLSHKAMQIAHLKFIQFSPTLSLQVTVRKLTAYETVEEKNVAGGLIFKAAAIGEPVVKIESL